MEQNKFNLQENSRNESPLRQIIITLQEVQEKINTLGSIPQLRSEWASKSDVMKFLGLGESRLLELTKEYHLTTSFFGKKKFYYIKSLQQILNKNKHTL